MHNKIKDNWSNKGQCYSAILIHAGTNDLVREDPEVVANNLDNFIMDIKVHAEKISISSVIERHDGLVPPERITTFNKLARDLSVKHDVDFVDNIHINKSFLNSSNLHLNNKGDKALGKAFCTYLKSLRQKNNVAINSFSNTNESFLFHPHYTRKRPVPVDNNWTRYLNYVYHATRM